LRAGQREIGNRRVEIVLIYVCMGNRRSSARILSYMPAYSFHLCTSRATRPIKNDRSEFDNVGDALAEAARIGRGMIRQRVRRKACAMRAHLDVRDDGDAPVARILLSELARQIS
jgi:hypothetical protein